MSEWRVKAILKKGYVAEITFPAEDAATEDEAIRLAKDFILEGNAHEPDFLGNKVITLADIDTIRSGLYKTGSQ